MILADEPMSAIDVRAHQILDTFAAIRAARPSTAIIMVSHDLGVVQHIADRILVLHDGRLEETVPPLKCSATPNPITPVSSSRQPRYRPFLAPLLRGAGRRRHALVAGCAMV